MLTVIRGNFPHHLYQQVMVHSVKILFQVKVNNIRVPFLIVFLCTLHGLLYHSVYYCWHSQQPFPAVGFWYLYPFDGLIGLYHPVSVFGLAYSSTLRFLRFNTLRND